MSDFLFLMAGLAVGVVAGHVITGLRKSWAEEREWDQMVAKFAKTRFPHPMDQRWKNRPDGWRK